MADFVTMIPSGGWRALLELKSGGSRDVPLVGWCLSENDAVVPFFYPGAAWCAEELSQAAIGRNPDWGITGYRVYHPDEKTGGAPLDLPASPGPVVHLMITDPDDQEFSETFTACCRLNWRAVTGEGMVTGNRTLATCAGRRPWEPQ